jgi:hypothetical protein
MADELRMALAEVLRKAGMGQADFLREGVRVLAEELMEMELAGHLGAERHERTVDRHADHDGRSGRARSHRRTSAKAEHASEAAPEMPAPGHPPSKHMPRGTGPESTGPEPPARDTSP